MKSVFIPISLLLIYSIPMIVSWACLVEWLFQEYVEDDFITYGERTEFYKLVGTLGLVALVPVINIWLAYVLLQDSIMLDKLKKKFLAHK